MNDSGKQASDCRSKITAQATPRAMPIAVADHHRVTSAEGSCDLRGDAQVRCSSAAHRQSL